MTCFLFLRSCLSCFCCFLGVTSVLQADGANSASASFCSAYTIKINLVTKTGSIQEFQQIAKKGSAIQLCLTRTDFKTFETLLSLKASATWLVPTLLCWSSACSSMGISIVDTSLPPSTMQPQSVLQVDKKKLATTNGAKVNVHLMNKIKLN